MNNPVLPWYIAGPLIGLAVPLLLVLTNKQLGISSSFRAVLSFVFPSVPYFKYDRKADFWQLWFALGIILAAVVHFQFLSFEPVAKSAFDPYQLIYAAQFAGGGLLVGFGARYANGCTAGHCIMGNAQFSIGSMVSTVGFFIGGLLTTHFLVPILF
jgi:uncharacterized membrane protein YedE/YeeE